MLFAKTKSKQAENYIDIELNIDSLQVFMDSNYPKRRKNLDETGKLLNQMNEYNIDLNDLQTCWEKVKPNFKELEKEYWNKLRGATGIIGFAQVGIARFSLDLVSEKFRNRTKSTAIENEFKILRKKYIA